MKNDINWYIDTAKELNGIKSDRKLAAHLGLATLGDWRNPYRHSVPAANVMLRLAELAKVPQEVALLDRDIWEASFKAPETVPIYENIKKALKKLPHIAAMLSVLIALTAAFITFDGGTTANAAPLTGSIGTGTIYIMEYFMGVFVCILLYAG